MNGPGRCKALSSVVAERCDHQFLHRAIRRVSAIAPYIAGSLETLLWWRKKWRDQYFVLAGPRLAWFKSSKASAGELVDSLDLAGAMVDENS